MNNPAQSSPSAASFSHLAVASTYILIRRTMGDLGVELPPNDTVIEGLNVGRSQAYALVDRVEAALVGVTRPMGRPKKQAATQADELHEVTRAVRDYLMEHPGAVTPGLERRRYSDDFRRFVVGLYDPSPAFDAFADAVGLSRHTLRPWFAQDLASTTDDDEGEDEEAEEEEGGALIDHAGRGGVAMIKALWRSWSGNLVAFQRALKNEHKLDVRLETLRELLRIGGGRLTQSRGSKPNAEAIQKALERFFPGAQWVGDGKTLEVTVGESTFAFTWELVVDAFEGAHIGFAVRDTEDGAGVVEALGHAVSTTGAAPLAVLFDNRPSNHVTEVGDKVEEMNALKMSSTLYRAQNKASVEGAFGLFAQTMIPIAIDASSPRELARSALYNILFAYCAGRNHVPRKSRGTPASNYLDARPTDEEIAAANERLREIEERIRRRNERDARALDPVLRILVEEAFARHGLEDPEGYFIPSIARYGLDAVTEAIAVFDRVISHKSLDEPERYLLGIARNIADRNDHQAVYERLLELRTQAKDLALRPWTSLDAERRRTEGPQAYLDATLHDALDAELPIIARTFFRMRHLEALKALAAHRRDEEARRAARLVSVSYGLPKKERNLFIARLADVVA